ncbi:unnamed protein product [Moneuplotes crassus]|uniref:Uncharacterized protein n=1 Tax=Euplotes crassus TaxID=5936 RepID=A0AAD1U4V5_EUPCR|nr:unnamed protein product [Moneuplotes crassus]
MDRAALDQHLKPLQMQFDEYREKTDSAHRSIMSIRGEFNIISEQVFETQRKIEEILGTLHKIDEKADKDDLQKTNTRFQDFVPYYEYKEIVESLKELAKQSDLDQASVDIQHLEEQVNFLSQTLKIKLRYTKDEIKDIFKTTRAEIDAHLQSTYCPINVFNMENKMKKDSIESLSESSSNYKSVISDFSNKLRSLELKIANKAEKSDVKVKTDALWKNFDNCCQYEHIERVKLRVEPLAETCSRRLERFTRDNQEMKNIINRFDEILLEKASKFSVDKLVEKIRDYATETSLEEMTNNVGQLKLDFEQKMEHLQESIDHKQSEIAQDLESKLEHGQNIIKKQVIEHLGETPLTIEEIRELLSTKADKADLGILDKTKTDKYETDNFKEVVKSLTIKNDHILTLLIEGFKIDIDSKLAPEHNLINKKATVLSQLIGLYNWSRKKDTDLLELDIPGPIGPKSAKRNLNLKLKKNKFSFCAKRESCPHNPYSSENFDDAANLSKFGHKIFPRQASNLLQKSKNLGKSRIGSFKALRCRTSHNSRSYSRVSSRERHLRRHQRLSDPGVQKPTIQVQESVKSLKENA